MRLNRDAQSFCRRLGHRQQELVFRVARARQHGQPGKRRHDLLQRFDARRGRLIGSQPHAGDVAPGMI